VSNFYQNLSEADKKTYRELNRANMLTRHGPLYYLAMAAKKRAKRDGREYSLDPKAIYLPERCPVLGIPISYPSSEVKKESQGPRANSASLDRIDNERGYTNDNVRVISYAANRLIGEMTKADVEALYYYTFPDRAPKDWKRTAPSTYGSKNAGKNTK